MRIIDKYLNGEITLNSIHTRHIRVVDLYTAISDDGVSGGQFISYEEYNYLNTILPKIRSIANRVYYTDLTEEQQILIKLIL